MVNKSKNNTFYDTPILPIGFNLNKPANLALLKCFCK